MAQSKEPYLPPRMMLRLCVAVLFASHYVRGVDVFTCDDDELGASTSLLQTDSGLSGKVVKDKLRTNGATYFWPSARGHAGRYGTSEVTAIRDISAGPTWSWQDSKGRWSDIPTGVSIDDKKQIYLTLATGATKFSPSGQVVWEYKRASPEEQISDASSIWGGALYGLTSAGRAFAVDIETGKELWSKKVGSSKTLNFGQVAAHDDVVIVASQTDPVGTALRHPGLSLLGSADDTITGLRTTDGSVLWTFKPENPVWNFAASFVGDGSFVFQDVTGKAHRAFVNNGSLIWSAGGTDKSWTDGHASIGPNGIAYSVANYPPKMDHGVLTAFRMTDGKVLWSQNTSRPPNGAPVVGKLFGKDSYSVVLPGGQQCKKGEQIVVYAYDSESGKPQWTFFGPRQQGDDVAGDAEGVVARLANNIRPKTMPNPWGQAVIDKAGTVFVGGETGHFFSLRDADGDGEINPNDSAEVSVFDAGAAWVGSSGPALADGMLAVAPQDRLHVWRW